MDDHPDPILQFFTEKEAEFPDILYKALDLSSTCAAEDIKRAYRKAALRLHPDKHASKSVDERERLSKEFQKVGFAYAVVGDEGKRKRYDATGRTDDLPFGDAESMGWDAYFESLYQRVDRKMLDDDKARYQGSQDELDELAKAYTSTSGSLPQMIESIPHSQVSDEPRFITHINSLISTGKLTSTKKWTTTSTDEEARARRVKAAEKAAKEAEKVAKELGIHDEFYGSGKKGTRKGKENEGGGGGGEDGLAVLIAKRQREREGGLNALEEKYRRIEEEERERKRVKGKGKKGKKEVEEDGMAPPDISDADFEALQAKMFAKKDGVSEKPKQGRKVKA